jgi:ClpA/ClpB-like protein/UvrB/UvrC motif-containing protein
MYPFERFNEDAKRSLTLAQEEAERSRHSYIGTEHLLLGLLRVERGTACRALTGLGIEIESVREAIKTVIGRSERILIQSMIPTSRVKKVIELSFEEARRMDHTEVDTGHMLLGLIIEGEGIAAHVLKDLGATLENVRPKVDQLLGARPTERPDVPRRRPRVRFGGRQPMGLSAGRLEFPPTFSTDATGLRRLLQSPNIARLLKAKGLDVEALEKQLAAPPGKVVELRTRLALSSQSLETAVQAQDFEVAAKLRDEIGELAGKLATAEEEWLDSLA